ncbi:hypothetical protein WA026_007911 [Henosepilachna vigintioctopunctata]|uniref:Amino acid transporter transmembrane domain-containing protein n=1 Tax=Henosepilachna vigintioctopunctata TaxID=420089 RepID=A0AAW1U5J4_9CUCU
MDDIVVYRIDENDVHCEVQEEDYDPYLKRDSKVQITNFQALFLLIQGFIGTSVLYAVFVYKEGWLTATIYIILIAILCNHCLHILLNAKYRLCKLLKVPNLSYGESMERALETGPPILRIFSRISNCTVDTCLILCQLALCCNYSSIIIVLVPTTAEKFLQEWFNTSFTLLFFISLIPLLLAPFMKNLRILANFCILGAIFLFGALIFFNWYVLEDFPSFDGLEITEPNVANLPYFLSPIVLSLQAVNVVSFMEGDLRSPIKFKQFWGTLNFGVLIIVIFQCSIGILAYFKFGQMADGLYFAISNESDQRLRVCILLYGLALYVSYGVQGYIFVELLWRKTERRRSRTKFFLRILLFVLSFSFMVVKSSQISPIAEYIIRIVLVVTVTLLGIIFPVILDICVKWPHDFRRAKYFICVNFMLIIAGIIIISSILGINEISINK